MTNLIYLITVLSTNWVATGDTKRENGTNYVQYRSVVTEQMLIEEVMLCTNRTVYKIGQSKTNGVRWNLSGSLLPPLPL